jgi:hypothetical protein
VITGPGPGAFGKAMIAFVQRARGDDDTTIFAQPPNRGDTFRAPLCVGARVC